MKPARPFFSSGPCPKRPGWRPKALRDGLFGRSHRSTAGRAKLNEAITRSRELLDLPSDHLIGIVPASDTGAVEIALWSLLGPRAVDVLAWESFGKGWAVDVAGQLRLDDVRTLEAQYGHLPDLTRVDFSRDVVFTWNGTTSGVRVPNGNWIAPNREGLTIADATSAAFATRLPWTELDVATYSWQKVLGGEAAHGMLILGPRAVDRLESHKPSWPMPKIFRLTKDGRLNRGLFSGSTINTPSMLCVEDYLDALRWSESMGGLAALIQRADDNLRIIEDWVDATSWIGFLPIDPATRSNTSVCLRIVEPEFLRLPPSEQRGLTEKLATALEAEGVGYDIGAYRDAPPGLRIWAGPTVDADDLRALLPWIEWAYRSVAKGVAA